MEAYIWLIFTMVPNAFQQLEGTDPTLLVCLKAPNICFFSSSIMKHVVHPLSTKICRFLFGGGLSSLIFTLPPNFVSSLNLTSNGFLFYIRSLIKILNTLWLGNNTIAGPQDLSAWWFACTRLPKPGCCRTPQSLCLSQQVCHARSLYPSQPQDLILKIFWRHISQIGANIKERWGKEFLRMILYVLLEHHSHIFSALL